MGKERYLEILIALNQLRKNKGRVQGEMIAVSSYWLCLFLIPLPSFSTTSRMMSSNLCGWLGLGSINNLALCKCQSVSGSFHTLCHSHRKGLSLSVVVTLSQKGSVCLSLVVTFPQKGSISLSGSATFQTPLCSLAGLCSKPGSSASMAGLHSGLCMSRAQPAAI